MFPFPWIIFFILLVAAILGAFAVLPYSLSLNPQTIQKIKAAASGAAEAAAVKARRRMPLPVMIVVGILQTVVLFAVAIFLGLLAGKQVGLGAPILQAALAGRPVAGLVLEMLLPAILLGLAAGIIMLVLEFAYFKPRIPQELASVDTRMPLWKRALACFYGGMDEEMLMRLFVMSALVWLLNLVWKTPAGAPALGAFWLANILAALLFGAGHLPATVSVTRLTPVVVFRALLLNGIPGVACGYLFMRYGLEAAMLSHFSLDILIHIIAPSLSGALEHTFPLKHQSQNA